MVAKHSQGILKQGVAKPVTYVNILGSNEQFSACLSEIENGLLLTN